MPPNYCLNQRLRSQHFLATCRGGRYRRQQEINHCTNLMWGNIFHMHAWNTCTRSRLTPPPRAEIIHQLVRHRIPIHKQPNIQAPIIWEIDPGEAEPPVMCSWACWEVEIQTLSLLGLGPLSVSFNWNGCVLKPSDVSSSSFCFYQL